MDEKEHPDYKEATVVFNYCERCFALDPIKQANITENRINKFKSGLEVLAYKGIITIEDKKALYSACEACHSGRIKNSRMRQVIQSSFEKMGIHDPDKQGKR